jgi:GDP-L-fucose synthase
MGLAHAKRAIYAQGIAYRTQWSFPVIHLIPPSLYGPEDHFDLESSHVATALIRRFVEACQSGAREVICWGTGRAVREFLYVEDAVAGILKAAAEYDDPAPLNIGTGAPTTIRDLATLIGELTEFTGSVRWDDTKPEGSLRKVLSVDRCRDLLDWSPRIPLKEGLERTIRWYRENANQG